MILVIFHFEVTEQKWKKQQESCAIAKMTAQCADCALYMGALKIFVNP